MRCRPALIQPANGVIGVKLERIAAFRMPMRTLLTALTALMLFTTPVLAGDFEDAAAAHEVGDSKKAFQLW